MSDIVLSAKELQQLRICAGSLGSYPGDRADLIAPKVARKLLAARLVYSWSPYNPAHKERLVATEKGEELLRSLGEKL